MISCGLRTPTIGISSLNHLELLTAVGLVAVSVLVTTAALTGVVRRYALRRSLLDIPNERSLHDRPTPRGGGLAIAMVLLATSVGLGWRGILSAPLVTALAGGGALIATVGWIDDQRPMPALWRACVHLVAAVWALYWLGGFPKLALGRTTLPLEWMGAVLAGLGTAWLTNLYNFMDGTDGLAASQGVCAGVMGAILLTLNGEPGIATMSLILAASCAGFLSWNWPPAKIFMGDVGSCLIGYSFAVLALVSESTGAVPVLTWFVLLAIFVCDATFTLLMRLLAGERWYAAHRSHAYQRLVQMGLSHGRLALAMLALNLFILWPLAYLMHWCPALSLPIAIAVVVGLGAAWVAVQRKYRRFYQSAACAADNRAIGTRNGEQLT
jgi:Fuc2NAc and GlcNAc transferase